MKARQIVATWALLALPLAASFGILPAQEPTPQPTEPATHSADEDSPVRMQPEVARQVMEQAARFRKSQSLAALRASEPLEKAAEDFARFMARTAKYGHQADEREPRDRAAEAKYEACIVAENIGLHASARPQAAKDLARVLVEGWKNSANHRANLLDPDLTETGVGVAQSEKSGKYYAVQLFDRPRSESIRVQIENRAGALVQYKLGEQSFDLESDVIRIHELCRPSDFTFVLPTAKDPERTAVEEVKAKTILVIQRDDLQELTVMRPTVVKR